MKHIFYIIALAVIPLQGGKKTIKPYTIEPINEQRDVAAVEKILYDNAKAIDYHYRIIEDEILDQSGTTEVLRAHNTTVGVIHYQTNYDPLSCYNPCSKYGYVRLIAIDENHRQKGYGRALLQHAMNTMEEKDVSYIYLIAPKKNYSAQKMYQQVGFSSNTTLLPYFDIDHYLRPVFQIFPTVKNNREILYKNYAPEAVQRKQALITRTMEKCTLAGLLAVYLWKML